MKTLLQQQIWIIFCIKICYLANKLLSFKYFCFRAHIWSKPRLTMGSIEKKRITIWIIPLNIDHVILFQIAKKKILLDQQHHINRGNKIEDDWIQGYSWYQTKKYCESKVENLREKYRFEFEVYMYVYISFFPHSWAVLLKVRSRSNKQEKQILCR